MESELLKIIVNRPNQFQDQLQVARSTTIGQLKKMIHAVGNLQLKDTNQGKKELQEDDVIGNLLTYSNPLESELEFVLHCPRIYISVSVNHSTTTVVFTLYYEHFYTLRDFKQLLHEQHPEEIGSPAFQHWYHMEDENQELKQELNNQFRLDMMATKSQRSFRCMIEQSVLINVIYNTFKHHQFFITKTTTLQQLKQMFYEQCFCKMDYQQWYQQSEEKMINQLLHNDDILLEIWNPSENPTKQFICFCEYDIDIIYSYSGQGQGPEPDPHCIHHHSHISELSKLYTLFKLYHPPSLDITWIEINGQQFNTQDPFFRNTSLREWIVLKNIETNSLQIHVLGTIINMYLYPNGKDPIAILNINKNSITLPQIHEYMKNFFTREAEFQIAIRIKRNVYIGGMKDPPLLLRNKLMKNEPIYLMCY